MSIRVPLTPDGRVDVPALRRACAAEAGEPIPAPPTAEEAATYHRERAEIEAAIGLDHLRLASEHMKRVRS